MRFLQFLALFLLSVAAMQPARAQWAVIDAPAIVQLIQEVQAMEQEVQTTRAQLSQAKQALDTMTGNRGMQLLLSGTTRNYLPTSWNQLVDAQQEGAGAVNAYSGLAADVRGAMSANAVLSSRQLSLLAPVDQQQIAAGRQASALRQALAQEALVNVSARFASIQSLVNAISSATDQKGALDLQARISAELGMLQNEQTKLQILHVAMQAQDAVIQQRQQEQVIAGQGRFETRFRPVP